MPSKRKNFIVEELFSGKFRFSDKKFWSQKCTEHSKDYARVVVGCYVICQKVNVFDLPRQRLFEITIKFVLIRETLKNMK